MIWKFRRPTAKYKRGQRPVHRKSIGAAMSELDKSLALVGKAPKRKRGKR